MVKAWEHISNAILSDVLGDGDLAGHAQTFVLGRVTGRHPGQKSGYIVRHVAFCNFI